MVLDAISPCEYGLLRIVPPPLCISSPREAWASTPGGSRLSVKAEQGPAEEEAVRQHPHEGCRPGRRAAARHGYAQPRAPGIAADRDGADVFVPLVQRVHAGYDHGRSWPARS